MPESTQGCRSTIHTIKNKAKHAAKTCFRAIKSVFVYPKNGLCEPPPLERAYTDMITTRELTAWAARNPHSVCATLADGTCNVSPRGPFLPPLKRAYTDMITTRELAAWAARNPHSACATLTEESRRLNETLECITFLHRRRTTH